MRPFQKALVIVMIAVLALLSALPVMADELSDYKNSKSSIDSKIKDIRKEQQTVISKKNELLLNQKELEKIQKEEEAVYNQLLEEIETINAEIEKTIQAIAEAEENYNNQRELLKTRLKVMYENSNISFFGVLIQSDSLTEFAQKVEYLSFLSKKDKELSEQLDLAKKDVEYKKQLQEDLKLRKQTVAREKEGKIQELKASRSDIENKIRDTQSYLKRLEEQEDKLLKESAAIEKKIKELMSKNPYSKGPMKWPCPSSNKITDTFGMRVHPILKTRKLHTGIDIAASHGAAITAAKEGRVIVSGWQDGYGYTVIIDHGGGIASLYGHCSKLLVKEGDTVKQGQTIAKVGSTGWSTGPHLHFEVRENGAPVNPIGKYLKK